MSVAALLEDALGSAHGSIGDDRGLPLFKLIRRIREHDRSASWQAEVVDEELLAQGAPKDVVLQLVLLPDSLPPVRIARALEACLIDHPRIQLSHSAALPQAVLARVQPAEPSPLLPPLHWLPICDTVGGVLLVKELSEGVPLLTWRTARGASLGLGDIVELVETMAEALATLHRRGFAHGAMTPDSIAEQEYVTPNLAGDAEETVWVPKLVDLGLVRTLAEEGHVPAGPVALWCAPEAFQPEAVTDWRKADQLALGALLYALWTDQVPFDREEDGVSGADARERRRRQIEALPPPRGNPRARALGVTPAMSAACMRAMAADPADRFPSLDAFAAALRQALRETKASKSDESPAPSESTSPNAHITSRFRAASMPPGTDPGSHHGRPITAQSKPPHTATKDDAPGHTEKPAPAAVPWEAPEGAAPEEAHEEQPPQAASPSPSASRVRAEPQRSTRILSSPDEDEDNYPDHPDREEERERTAEIEVDDELRQALGAGKWAFNNLAAAFLVLWLATLALALLRGSGDEGTAAAPVKTAATKGVKAARVADEDAP